MPAPSSARYPLLSQVFPVIFESELVWMPSPVFREAVQSEIVEPESVRMPSSQLL